MFPDQPWNPELVDFTTLPAGATPNDRVVSYDDAGAPLYETFNGQRYAISYAPTQGGSRLRAFGNALATDPWGTAKGVGNALASSAWNAFTAPGRAAAGEPVTYGDALDTMGLIATGGIGNAVVAAPKSLASTRATLYNLPTSSEVGNVLGRSGSGGLDVDGRPLVARHVVGRTESGVGERSLAPAVLDEIAERYAGGPFAAVPQSRLPKGAVGAVTTTRYSGIPSDPRFLKTLNPNQAERVMGHEGGHIIDEIAGRIPTAGLSDELQGLYHYGVAGQFRETKRTLPQHSGYKGDDIPREYMAEAIRQYMAAPDTMKAKFPNTAKAIRKWVNENPRLMNFIQFNSMAGAAYGLGGGLENETRNYLAGSG